MTQENTAIRVCHLVISLDPGGLENGVVNLVNRLGAAGVESRVLCIRRRGQMADRVGDAVPVDSLGYAAGFSWRGVWRLARYLRRHRIGILHTRNQTALIWGGLARLLTPGVWHVHSEHGTAVNRHWLAAQLARRCHGLLAVCPSLADEMRRFYRLPDACHIAVVPNGVDTERFRPAGEAMQPGRRVVPPPTLAESASVVGGTWEAPQCADDQEAEFGAFAVNSRSAGGTASHTGDACPRPTNVRSDLGLAPETVLFACIGRLDHNKNQQLAIRAFAEMSGLPPTIHELPAETAGSMRPTTHDPRPRSLALIVIGDGPQRESLTALTAQLGLTGYVFFLGFRNDVDALLPQVDCLLLPSLSEGMANVVLEANACGVPAMASAIPGNQWLIEAGATGWLVPVVDRPSCAGREDTARSNGVPAVSGDPSGCIGEWVAAMACAAGNPWRRAEMGRQARASVLRRHAIDAMVAQYASVYRRVQAARTARA